MEFQKNKGHTVPGALRAAWRRPRASRAREGAPSSAGVRSGAGVSVALGPRSHVPSRRHVLMSFLKNAVAGGVRPGESCR